ncbi:oligosaccharide flippase family protein [Dechloromonas hortensis]|uniref:oligosaccharide flippase family protein n=1 Tax=Dechloromonas hortensis TaxID=337779 RepID=UPI001478EE71|nr:oligosaccharide flippase family protein [Dechloromonas hortensis]
MSIKIALLHSFIEKYVTLCLQLITTAIVSRLITPQEFGIFALALSITMLVQVFRDLGVGQYLVQERNLTNDRMRAALTILFASSIILASIVFFTRNILASYYSNEDLANLLLIIAPNFLAMPLGALALAKFKRDMQFNKVAFVGVASALSTAIVTILLALNNFSYFSLAWGMLAGSVATVISCFALRPEGLPLTPGLREIRHVISYSALATFNGLLETLEDRLSALLLGKFSDFNNIGLYERGSTLAQIFQRVIMQGVWGVAMPAFAKISRDGSGTSGLYARAVGMVCVVGLIFFAWVIIYADTIVKILLGDNWSEATLIVQLIAFGGIFSLPNYLSGSLLIATGQIKLQTLVTTVLRGSSMLAIAIGVSNGAKGVAICLIISSLLSNLWLLWRLKDYCALYQVLYEVRRALLICIPALFIAIILRSNYEKNILLDGVGFVLSLITWAACIYWTKPPLWEEIIGRNRQ